MKGINVKDFCFCTICPLAKQTRSSFPRHLIKSSEIFHLLHIDIWGPIRYTSRIKSNMFITIVDDCSRFSWILLIKNKSDFLCLFKQFYEYILTQFGKKIQNVRTDNAKELCGGDTLIFYKSKGIKP